MAGGPVQTAGPQESATLSRRVPDCPYTPPQTGPRIRQDGGQQPPVKPHRVAAGLPVRDRKEGLNA